MTGWREPRGVPIFIEGEINSRISLCVLLGRQWGILTADEQKSETHPTASIRLDSRYMKSNFCKEFICFSLPNALEMITYVQMVHWLSPPPQKKINLGYRENPSDTCTPEILERFREELQPLAAWPAQARSCHHVIRVGDRCVPILLLLGHLIYLKVVTSTPPHTHSFLFFPFNFIYSSFLAASKCLLLCGLSLFVLSRGSSRVVVHGLLITVASLVVERLLLGAWTSIILAHRLHCSEACGIFLDRGWNPCPLHWQVDSYPLDHQGGPGFIHSWSLTDSSPRPFF